MGMWMTMAVLAFLPRIIDALLRPIDYNGFWHIFIARNLSREWKNLQHPPLFLLLLRLSDSVSHSVLSYRVWSLAGGVATVLLTGLVLLRLGCRRWVVLAGSAIMAFSVNAIRLSNEVESYSLCVALVLAAFFFYVDVVGPSGPASPRARLGFSVCSCVAIGLHYFAGLFLTACAVAPLLVAALNPEYGKALRRALRRRWPADALTLLPGFGVGLLLYEVQAKRWVMPLSSLPSYYYQPGRETAGSFLVRNLRETFNLFAPVALPRARYALPILALFLAGVVLTVFLERGRAATQKSIPARAFPAATLLVLLAEGMALGLLGRYPFGGLMRHQFLLLLFALLAGMVAVDTIVRQPPVAGLEQVTQGVLAGALLLSLGAQLPKLLAPPQDRLAPIIKAHAQGLWAVGSVSVDQFNLVGLFTQFHNLTWRFRGRLPGRGAVEVYEIAGPGGRLMITAFREWWIFDFRDPRLYAELAGAWGSRGSHDCVLTIAGTIFDKPARQPLSKASRATIVQRIAAGSRSSDLMPRDVTVSEYGDVWACFSAEPTAR